MDPISGDFQGTFPQKIIFFNSQTKREKLSAIGRRLLSNTSDLVGISAIDFCPIVISQKPLSFYSRRN